jgi:hypothetical protein
VFTNMIESQRNSNRFLGRCTYHMSTVPHLWFRSIWIRMNMGESAFSSLQIRVQKNQQICDVIVFCFSFTSWETWKKWMNSTKNVTFWTWLKRVFFYRNFYNLSCKFYRFSLCISFMKVREPFMDKATNSRQEEHT